MTGEACTWCGEAVEAGDGFRCYEPAGERRAVFCRLEHVIPWTIRGAHWGTGAEPPDLGDGPFQCSHCGEEVPDVRVDLVRHRGEHRIADHFCSADHMNEWAKAGGRWA